MVKLNRIYTKTGDDGTTGLVGGVRVRKDDLRVEVYGTVDEGNAALGVAITLVPGPHAALAPILSAIQNDLFDLGADLATPMKPDEHPGKALRMVSAQTDRLERLIDEHNEALPALTSFVLPGGTPLAAALHVARTVVRRAERLAVALAAREPAGVNPEAIRYLNRLSDLLFVLARVANGGGTGDVLWVPGQGRSP
jgi:cob(I)alamin adenosyltransferase